MDEGAKLMGGMMEYALTVGAILERAGKYFCHVPVVWRRADGIVARARWGTVSDRATRLGRGLRAAGMRRGDRVATLLWNNSAHLECYLGIPAAGGVVHPLNVRLHEDEIAFIANHAGDRFLIVDEALLPLYLKIRHKVRFEQVFVNFEGQATGEAEGLPEYERLLAVHGEAAPPEMDEREAAAMCYTSGTTGRPKGVLYSHRAIALHSFAIALQDGFGFSQRDTVFAIAPMFHANAWGIPFAAAMIGTKLVLPGGKFDVQSLLELMAVERVTVACAVPTVWLCLLAELEKCPARWKFDQTVRGIAGGSAPPESLLRGLAKHGIELRHSWGMTETTPMATTNYLKSTLTDVSESEKQTLRMKQGLPAPFMEVRVTGENGLAPWDGKTAGEMEVRGPWVAASYFNAPEENCRWAEDGWFRTGDVACIDSEGYVKLVDRTKDLIKSGGEWISSVELETALMNHPAVREAAVIAVAHPKWLERPLAVVVLSEGMKVSAEELREFLARQFAKWQLPDDFVFASEIPRTSVGKFMKTRLREQFQDWKWKS
jgi:fatty-acyl-CoA synthase